ncbi:MAG: hypothetical protein FD124_1420 [Alphaproteobacteria bacterium]|nr:MAG: hypothetical protein FD160_3356 [Caulobacteraceae bacterium]TPW07063.1 MAG: hypothetical protein FD124_1420 [Alphaproteobacteria bacterium]
MGPLQFIASGAASAIDGVFDALSAILRVVIRGRFQPDASSHRGARFLPLATRDVLLQTIMLNAADAGQARRAVALDPGRHLPLALDVALFDVVGPMDDEATVRDRPERPFLLGVVRKEVLSRIRDELKSGRSTRVEAFVHAPSDHAHAALVFADDAGRRRRRMRRAALAIACAALAFSLWDAAGSAQSALDRAVATADADRLQGERRIRVAERRAQLAQQALDQLQTAPAPTLAVTSGRLARLAARLPLQSEFTEIALSGTDATLSGRTYDPAQLELELRRTFEGATIQFSSGQETPAPFDARVSLASVDQEAPR